ncbi:hypothetical protein MTR_1g060780 [Medicago truncatula]|uniref:RNase H type-1 domain-containing protein n=1 Tax=Medicago truncatula TaxID=3880 RepID=A0A072VKB7_MEDTR|nr:hypothetical protein MTR_1g060780 [Medicago truncatula]
MITSTDLFLKTLGVGGVVHNHYGDLIAGFSHYEVGGDALLAELRAIYICLDFCCKKCYDNIICESDCLESVELIINGCDCLVHYFLTLRLCL